MTISGSTYSGKDWGSSGSAYAGRPLVDGAFTGRGVVGQEGSNDDPSIRNSAVLGMMQWWSPINLCNGGTKTLRYRSEEVIPREPKEHDDAYQRRIFHAVMPPFLQRLAAQAAGTILRKGVHLEGDDYWAEWAQDVTGDGTTLDEYARRILVSSLLFGHCSTLVDNDAEGVPTNLLERRLQRDRKPYLVGVEAQQILGWRTAGNRAEARLSQVRYLERVSEPDGKFGESLQQQVRVLEPGRWETWRNDEPNGWALHESGTYDLDRIPLVTVYSNRLATLTSRPPLLDVAYLCIAYAQRFTDLHHSVHVGANPILTLRGFDPDSDTSLGLSANTAILLPPDGGAEYVAPTSDAFEVQLKVLEALESQISQLGVNTLSQANLTNAAAESRRIDRIDSDSIMAILAEDLERALTEIVSIAADYAGIEPPEVTIPKDYENRLLDGNQITAMLQLHMQNVISQETLLRILQEGEVLPPYIDMEEELSKTKDQLEEQMAMALEQQDAQLALQAEHMPAPAAGGGAPKAGGATTGKAGNGASKGSMTLPTPMRPGKHAS